jgi:TfoX/Sxy family transcriptional regulator of competence genes
MAYDETLADRIRRQLGGRRGITEKKMFGGLAFLLDGKMFCGLTNDDLMARVGPNVYAEALREPHARPMDFTGRSMNGYVFVATKGLASDATLARWVTRCADFVKTVERKPAKKRSKKKR